MTFQEIQKLLAQGFTPEMITQLSATPSPAAVLQAEEEKPVVVKGFEAKKAEGLPCRLCGNQLGSDACCGKSCDDRTLAHAERLGIQAGSMRVAFRDLLYASLSEKGKPAGRCYKDCVVDKIATALKVKAASAASPAMEQPLPSSPQEVDERAEANPAYSRLAALVQEMKRKEEKPSVAERVAAKVAQREEAKRDQERRNQVTNEEIDLLLLASGFQV